MLRALITCVDYSDYLDLCLSYNTNKFNSITVLTSLDDKATEKVVNKHSSRSYPIGVFKTDAFYRMGAHFNKYWAVEECLSHMGREGWLCVMDADIVIPKQVFFSEGEEGLVVSGTNPALAVKIHQDNLFTPARRMCEVPLTRLCQDGIPPEHDWGMYPLHRNMAEHAGYMHLFHSGSKFLGSPPWYHIDWKHAGGADSFFQSKWPPRNKIRPVEWQVLHLGPAGTNWCGRVTPLADGQMPEGHAERAKAMKDTFDSRRRNRNFSSERL